MSENYRMPSPDYRYTTYTCPHCHVLTTHTVSEISRIDENGNEPIHHMVIKRCFACRRDVVWMGSTLVFPVGGKTAPPPNSDMPESIRLDYEEARAIADLSPRGAAVLLRFALQRLLQELAEHDGGVYGLIHELEEKGMDARIGNMFHGVRIIGNSAAHPLEIDVNENPALVAASFQLLNYIVDDQISKPKHLESFYAQLPENAVQGIENKRRSTAKKRENQSA